MALTSNLAAYWKFDESSGNASDSSGNSKTLVNTGSTPYASAKINNGADFGATNSGKYFSIADNLSFQLEMSYSLWFNCTTDISSAGNQYILLDNRTSGAIAYAQLLYRNDGGTRKLRFVSGDNITSYDINMGTGTWYHIAVTRSSGGSTTLYVNGSSVATGSSGATSGGANWCAIGDDTGGGGRTQGLIDEAGVWNRAITGAEVTSLYNSGNGNSYPFPTYVLTAVVGTFTLTGINTGLLYARKMIAAVGAFTLTGYDALLAKGRGFIAEVGTFILTMQDVIVSFSGWTRQSKNSTTWTDESKSNSTWTNQNKN